MSQPERARRRRYERLPFEVEVSISSDHNFYTGFTQNISEGGIFVATFEVLPLGTPLEFSFRLGRDPEPIVVRGHVRWVREAHVSSHGLPCGMGVQFDEVSPQIQVRINQFIHRQRDSIFYD